MTNIAPWRGHRPLATGFLFLFCTALTMLLSGCFGGDAMDSGLRTEGTVPAPLGSGASASLVGITAQRTSVAVGGTTTLQCVARFADGSAMDVSSLATWTSANPQIATVTSNKATGVAQGRVVLQATYQGVNSSTRLTVGTPPNAKWNFLVYLDADNNLETYGLDNFYQMQAVGSSDDVNVLVLLDRGGQDSSNGGWTGTRLYRVTQSNGTLISSELQVDSPWGKDDDSIEADMSNKQTLTDFIVWCQQNYPADHTVLTLWNHGGGVYPRSVQGKPARKRSTRSTTRSTTKGVCWDDTTGTGAWNCLTTDAVQQALANARAQTNQKIDVMNVDACLEQMIEFAYQNRSEMDFLVGSEETVPGPGNNYTLILQRMAANPSISPRNLALGLVDDYQSYYGPQALGVTYSALDMGQMDAFMVAFRAFANELKGIADNRVANPAAMEALWQAQNASDYYDYPENIDLYDFASIANVSTSANLEAALDNLIIRNWADGTHAGTSHGVAILSPWRNEIWADYSSADRYPSLAFAQDTNWMPFIVMLAQWGTDHH